MAPPATSGATAVPATPPAPPGLAAAVVDITDLLAVEDSTQPSPCQLYWGGGGAAARRPSTGDAASLPPPPLAIIQPLPPPAAASPPPPPRPFKQVPPPASVAADPAARRAWLLGRVAAAVGRAGVPRAAWLPALQAAVAPLLQPPLDGGCVCCAARRAGCVEGGESEQGGLRAGAVEGSPPPAGGVVQVVASPQDDDRGRGASVEPEAVAAATATTGRRLPTVAELDAGGYFDMTIQDAAEALNVSVTALKKACRAAGVPRWPFRERGSVATLLAAAPGAGGPAGRRARAPRGPRRRKVEGG